MELRYFNYLPMIDERNNSERLKIFEKAKAKLPSTKGYHFFDVYVAGFNRDRMVVLSTQLDRDDSSLINFPSSIAIEPKFIEEYQS